MLTLTPNLFVIVPARRYRPHSGRSMRMPSPLVSTGRLFENADRLAVQESQRILDTLLEILGVDLAHAVTVMRRQCRVARAVQRIVGGQRLLREHIECG